jgi:polar amino acid transport system substrate-binding protein
MSNNRNIVIVLIVLTVVLLAGAAILAFFLLRSPAEPVAEDASWSRIQAAGKIVVGTSADYPPFEYYIDFQADGFDIALMREIGQRLGVEIEIKDFAFDGLGSALQLNQIDVAIAAISITPEREGFVDFSDVYYVGCRPAISSLTRSPETLSET